MKNPFVIPLTAVLLFGASGCDRQSPEISKKLAELERKNNEAADRQRELEQELEDQKLASERDAIERERARIEEDRADLEREQGQAAAAQDEELRKREEALSGREGKLERFQAALEEKEDGLQERNQQLSERDRDLAGREALPFQQTEQREPVADYGMFYDSLASYGSWFETPDYGYVWQPVAVRDANWRPYSRGRWVCSDRGWTWVSEEPFGWATYHYGRWALLRGRGWIWVPGSEWAPCWVSWRENDSHIGWAPLPPETLAYRGQAWDSSVDAQFGIGALWFSFVDIRNFGGPVYRHCLPVSGNYTIIQRTTNITYIHIENRQVICGGPRYRQICDRIGRQLPFYRLEVDQHPRPGRDSLGLRPRIKGDHLVVSAPNIDARWNDGIKPQRLKGRMESVTVERDKNLSDDITTRYRQSRQEGRQRADESIVELGGPEKFDQRRNEKLQDNRSQADPGGRQGETRGIAKNPDRAQREDPGSRIPERVDRPGSPGGRQDQPAEKADRRPEADVDPQVMEDRRDSDANDRPRVNPPEGPRQRQEQRTDPRPPRQAEQPRVAQKDDSARQENERPRQQDNNRRDPQRQADQSKDVQQEAMTRRQEEQAVQRQQQEKQREAEQVREARRQAAEQERAQRQQQEENQRRQAERAQRQQEAEQQREMQRQQERAQQRQQEENQRQQERAQQRQQEENQRQQERAQQRQQEENQRQQEQARQRQQEENQRQQEQARQRQQEENQRQRQQEESRQKQEKDQDEQRKKNR
ncbi:MAG: DUF6600 domain-containing protein [Verrucomicrobiota bacterium]